MAAFNLTYITCKNNGEEEWISLKKQGLSIGNIKDVLRKMQIKKPSNLHSQ